jgi:dTMP kinase
MAKAPGKLVVIEGTDGSGKGTQTKRLVRKLRREGIDALRIAFPQYTTSFFGKTIAAYLRGEFGTEVDPHLAAVLYAGDRFEARDKIIAALEAGRTIILDRYVDSNRAHQAANLKPRADRTAFLKWIDKMEYGVFGLPKPDCTLYLYVPVRISQKLIDRKAARSHLNGKKRDLHEADTRHLKRAEKAYLDIAKACPQRRGELIECVQGGELLSIPAIAAMIEAALSKRKLIP